MILAVPDRCSRRESRHQIIVAGPSQPARRQAHARICRSNCGDQQGTVVGGQRAVT